MSEDLNQNKKVDMISAMNKNKTQAKFSQV